MRLAIERYLETSRILTDSLYHMWFSHVGRGFLSIALGAETVSNFGLAFIYLKLAMREPGCPICNCCADHETRYLKFLLWENVNDVGTRRRLSASLGFCQRHAQQMLEMEQEQFGMLLGNSIIYESLAQLAGSKVRDAHQYITRQMQRKPFGERVRNWLGLRPSDAAPRRPPLLTPEESCRVCELSEETAVHYGDVLAEMLSHDQFRPLYEQSDGVCLPHLRTILGCARSGRGIEYLLANTEEKLAKLQADLEALGRSYTAQYRDQARDKNVSTSAQRAVDFLTGSSSSRNARG